MTKLIAIVAGLALGALGFASVQLASSGEPARTAAVGTTDDRPTTTDDRGATTAAGATTTGRERGEDLRGPCDEAEHAGDPRCGGSAAGENDDRGRHVSGGHDRSAQGSRGEDRSGSSGAGDRERSGSSGHGGDDSSGHARGDDD